MLAVPELQFSSMYVYRPHTFQRCNADLLGMPHCWPVSSVHEYSAWIMMLEGGLQDSTQFSGNILKFRAWRVWHLRPPLCHVLQACVEKCWHTWQGRCHFSSLPESLNKRSPQNTERYQTSCDFHMFYQQTMQKVQTHLWVTTRWVIRYGVTSHDSFWYTLILGRIHRRLNIFNK